MKEIIKIHEEKNNNLKQTVNARELHEFLEIKSDFRNWIKNYIKDFEFIEGEDYIISSVNIYRGKIKEYFITIDMAKELSMLSRNEKGKQARKYFIDKEKKYNKLFNKSDLFEKEMLSKSIENRNGLTAEWKIHDAKNYGKLTICEYEAIFKDKNIRKKNMDDDQKTLLSAFEYLESLKLENNQDIKGDAMLSSSLKETGNQIENIIRKKIS